MYFLGKQISASSVQQQVNRSTVKRAVFTKPQSSRKSFAGQRKMWIIVIQSGSFIGIKVIKWKRDCATWRRRRFVRVTTTNVFCTVTILPGKIVSYSRYHRSRRNCGIVFKTYELVPGRSSNRCHLHYEFLSRFQSKTLRFLSTHTHIHTPRKVPERLDTVDRVCGAYAVSVSNASFVDNFTRRWTNNTS